MDEKGNKVKKIPLLLIVGPTATEKSLIALKLAKALGGEIVNADSRQIYKYCIIGTNSPEFDRLENVSHYLYNFLEPQVRFSAAEYAKLAYDKIKEIVERKKLPIVVGGSGLYIRALIEGFFTAPPANIELRNSLKNIAKIMGSEFIHKQLAFIDPESAKKILKNDLLRIIRAIEIFALTGELKSSLQKKQKKEKKFNVFKLGILVPKKELHYKIEKRINEMIKKGLLDEVNFLINNYGYNIPALEAIGYKELVSYFKKEISLDAAIALIKRNTKKYAKRQLTWFKADKEIIWKDKEECLEDSFIDSIKLFFINSL